MANASGRVHVNNVQGSTSHLVLFHSGGQFKPDLNNVDSVTGTQTGSTDTFEWDGEIIIEGSNTKHLLIELTCTTGRAAAAKKPKIVSDGSPTDGTVTITLSGGNPPPPNPVPVTYVNDGT